MGRFYFFIKNVELTSNPHNGVVFGGCGPAIGWVRLGGELFLVRDVIESGKYRGRDFDRYAITPEDFGGPVRVKSWMPKAEYTEWFVLATAEMIAAAGLKLIPHNNATGGPAI